MEAFSADFNSLKTQWCSCSWTVWGGNQSSSDPSLQLCQSGGSAGCKQQSELAPQKCLLHTLPVLQERPELQAAVEAPPLHSQLQALQKPKGAPSQPHSNPSWPCRAINTSHLISLCLSHISLTATWLKSHGFDSAGTPRKNAGCLFFLLNTPDIFPPATTPLLCARPELLFCTGLLPKQLPVPHLCNGIPVVPSPEPCTVVCDCLHLQLWDGK